MLCTDIMNTVSSRLLTKPITRLGNGIVRYFYIYRKFRDLAIWYLVYLFYVQNELKVCMVCLLNQWYDLILAVGGIMPAPVDKDYFFELMKTLNILFPQVNLNEEHLKINRLIANNKLDYKNKSNLVVNMMKSNYFKRLFPNDNLLKKLGWDIMNKQDELNIAVQNGCSVIRYFLNEIDEKFFNSFNEVVCEDMKLEVSPATDVLDIFLDNYNKTYTIEEFNKIDFPNICKHKGISLYNVYVFFARKQYTLIRLSREFHVLALHEEIKKNISDKIKEEKSNLYALNHFYNNFISTYINVYTKYNNITSENEILYANNILKELFVHNLKEMQDINNHSKKMHNLTANKVNVKNYEGKIDSLSEKIGESTEKISKVWEMIDCQLESKLKNCTNPFAPKDFMTITMQISGQIKHVFRKTRNTNYINKKMKKDISDNKPILEHRELQKLDNYWGELYAKLLEYYKEKKDVLLPYFQRIESSKDNLKECLEILKDSLEKDYYNIQNDVEATLYFNSKDYIKLYRYLKRMKKERDKDKEERKRKNIAVKLTTFDKIKILNIFIDLFTTTKIKGIEKLYKNIKITEGEIDQETEDDKYLDISEVIIMDLDRKEFEPYLRREFAHPSENSFVKYIIEKGPWETIILKELYMYCKKGQHMQNSHIFGVYLENREFNEKSHDLFRTKIRKARKAYINGEKK